MKSPHPRAAASIAAHFRLIARTGAIAASGTTTVDEPMTAIAVATAHKIETRCSIRPTSFDWEWRRSTRLRRDGACRQRLTSAADATAPPPKKAAQSPAQGEANANALSGRARISDRLADGRDLSALDSGARDRGAPEEIRRALGRQRHPGERARKLGRNHHQGRGKGEADRCGLAAAAPKDHRDRHCIGGLQEKLRHEPRIAPDDAAFLGAQRGADAGAKARRPVRWPACARRRARRDHRGLSEAIAEQKAREREDRGAETRPGEHRCRLAARGAHGGPDKIRQRRAAVHGRREHGQHRRAGSIGKHGDGLRSEREGCADRRRRDLAEEAGAPWPHREEKADRENDSEPGSREPRRHEGGIEPKPARMPPRRDTHNIAYEINGNEQTNLR